MSDEIVSLRMLLHIVFIDCHMPDPDGFATMSEIKRIHPAAKVVMITGTRDMRIEDRARATPATFSTSRSSPMTSTPCCAGPSGLLHPNESRGPYWRAMRTLNSPSRMRCARVPAYWAAAASP
jgi:CheY-like chemotaxis protein